MNKPNIIASRLKEARLAKGLSQQELAQLVGNTSQAISQYENGSRSIAGDIVNSLSRALDVPSSFFYAEKKRTVTTQGPLFFRALQTIRSNKHRAKYLTKTKWLVELYQWLEERVEFPIPNLLHPHPEEYWSHDRIESVVDELRRFWGLGLGPIKKLPALLESNGVIILRLDTDDIKTDAFSGYFDGRPIVFLNISKRNTARSRFDLGHELGHIVLHNHLSEDAIEARLRDIEKEADYFSGAFLMPERTFSAEVFDTSLSGFRRLKPRWGVSIQSMIMRSSQLGLIDDDRKTELYRQLSSKGWRKSEPDDELVERDDSSIGKKAFKMLIEHDPYMAERIQTDQLVDMKLLQTAFGMDDADLNRNNLIEFQPALRPSL